MVCCTAREQHYVQSVRMPVANCILVSDVPIVAGSAMVLVVLQQGGTLLLAVRQFWSGVTLI